MKDKLNEESGLWKLILLPFKPGKWDIKERRRNPFLIIKDQKGKKKTNIVAQACLTLCRPMDCSQTGSSVHGILQARILEWVAISFSRGGLLNTGIKLRLPALWADSLPSELPEKPIKDQVRILGPKLRNWNKTNINKC